MIVVEHMLRIIGKPNTKFEVMDITRHQLLRRVECFFVALLIANCFDIRSKQFFY